MKVYIYSNVLIVNIKIVLNFYALGTCTIGLRTCTLSLCFIKILGLKFMQNTFVLCA